MTHARATRLLLIALVLLGLGWLLTPRWAPPIYDGVGFPDEPYRFVVKPDGAPTTKPPTTASWTVTVTKGTAGAASAASAEQAPQVAILVPTGRLQAPAGTKRFVLRAAPVRPIPAPSGGYLWSDVYSVGSTDAKITMRNGNPPATITLRAATAQRPYPTIERFSGGTWTKLSTVPVGNDIYQASMPGLGKYAVIGSSPLDVSQLRGASSTKAGASKLGVVIAVIAVVVVAVLVLVGVRRRRTRADADEWEDAEQPDDAENPDEGAIT